MTRTPSPWSARLLAFAIALVALPTLADAPNTGADRQYDFFTGADVVVTDRFTKLVWERPRSNAPYPSRASFSDAQQRCTNSGTRLPSMKELLTLVDEEPHAEYEVNKNVTKLIDQAAFGGTPSNDDDDFWTLSTDPTSSSRIFTVNFGTGLTNTAQKSDLRRVRCVSARL